MNKLFATLSMALGSALLAGCPPTAMPPAGPAGTVFCAKLRTQNCPEAAMCASVTNPTTVGVPAVCLTVWNRWLTCLDNTPSTLTCAQLTNSTTCGAEFMAVAQCNSMLVDGGVSDGGTSPTDSGTTPPLPSPAEWPMGQATYTLSGGNLATPQSGSGDAMLTVGPIGTPSNAQILSFSWNGYLGAPSNLENCRFGLVWDEATRRYTFSANPQLTQLCTITGMGEADSTLTFTNATVSLSPTNNLTVRVNVTGGGPRFSGMGTLDIVYPPR